MQHTWAMMTGPRTSEVGFKQADSQLHKVAHVLLQLRIGIAKQNTV